MSRDIRIPVMVTPEEYLGAKVVAEDAGHSLSGRVRQLIRRAISDFAQHDALQDRASSAKSAQD